MDTIFPLRKDIENLPACTIFVGFYSKFNDDLLVAIITFERAWPNLRSIPPIKSKEENQTDGRPETNPLTWWHLEVAAANGSETWRFGRECQCRPQLKP